MIASIVTFVVVVAFLMVTLIYVQWLYWTEPSSMIVVEADAAAAGVLVQVARVRPDGTEVGMVKEEIDADNGYTARFFLEPGVYQVKASRSEEHALDKLVNLQNDRMFRMTLKGRFAPPESSGPTE
jgi:ABC-type transporter Mla subunit MlaD